MAYKDIGPITAGDADNETDRLFDDAPATPPALELPDDLLRLGFKLIVRAPNQMFAVSTDWGCTGTKGMIGAVVREARAMVARSKQRMGR